MVQPLLPKTTAAPHTETRAASPSQDTSSLPLVTAPHSHPLINPSEPGVIDGRSIFEVDMDALSEKPWRRPGSDISDYFNYGFDEVSWEAYCYRRRDMTEMANHLKGAVTVCAILLTTCIRYRMRCLLRILPVSPKTKLLHFLQRFEQWSWLVPRLLCLGEQLVLK